MTRAARGLRQIKRPGIQLNHIPYKGTAPALQDLAGGQIEATLVSLQGVGGLLQSGRARALAITSPKRVDAAPNIPTFAESGYPGFDLTLWYGMTGPKGIPEPVVRKLNPARACRRRRTGRAAGTALGSR